MFALDSFKEIIMETQETKESAEQTTKAYLEYEEDFKKINYFKIGIKILEIILAFLLIFLPIFISENVTPTLTIEDFNNDVIAYSKYLSSLTSKSFSIFDELIRNIDFIITDDSENAAIALVYVLFPAFSAVMAIVLLVTVGKELYSFIVADKDTEKLAMLEYNKIKKTGYIDKKKGGFFKKQSALALITFIFCAVIYGVIMSKIFDMSPFAGAINQITYLSSLKGVSAQIVFPIIFLVGYAVMTYFTKKKENKVLTDITTKEYNS